MPIKLCAIDCDGCLVEAREIHYRSLNDALSEWQSVSAFRDYTISEEAHEKVFNGLPTKTKLEILTQTKGLPKESHKVIEELKQKYTIKLIKEKIKAKDYAHIHEVLEWLGVKGYQIACCSNSISETLHLMLECAGHKKYLHQIISNQDVISPKPDPEIYLKAMYIAGVHPWETLVIEDSDKGICAAKASNANLLTVKSSADITLDNVVAFIQNIDDYFDKYLGK